MSGWWWSIREVVLSAARGAAAALLPQPHCSRLANAWGVDVARCSFLLGVAQAPAAGLLFFGGAIRSVQGTAPVLSALLLEHWFPELNEGHFMGTGAIGLLAWYLNPLAWLLALECVTGALRIAAFVASREAVGEPLVWAGLRLARLARDLVRGTVRARDLGPQRPDRLLWGTGGALEILSCRERPEWTPGITLEVEGRFFRRLGVEPRPDGVHQALAYRWQELHPNEVIRHPVPYQPLPLTELARPALDPEGSGQVQG